NFQPVEYISAFLDADVDEGMPYPLRESQGWVVVGSEWGGDYFLLPNELAAELHRKDPASSAVIKPVINADELNNDPFQAPSRNIIYFGDCSLEKAKLHRTAFEILRQQFDAVGESDRTAKAREDWWRFRRPTTKLYTRIRPLSRCFVPGRHSKYLNF